MKLRPSKRRILWLKKLLRRRGRNHRLHTRVLHRGDIDLPREAESTEEGLPGDTRGPGGSAHRRDEEGFQGLREGTADIRCREAGVDRGTIVTDHGADYRRRLDAGDPTLEEDQGRPEDRGTGGKDRGIVAEVAAGREVDLNDPP